MGGPRTRTAQGKEGSFAPTEKKGYIWDGGCGGHGELLLNNAEFKSHCFLF